jgi:cation transport ATPase
VDGQVVQGEAAVDQASLTGESLPVPVAAGSPVLSGSVIHEGHIRIAAEQVGAETSMARINRFLEDDAGVDCTPADALMADLYAAGKSLLYVARNGRLVGLIALIDRIRPEAEAALADLKRPPSTSPSTQAPRRPQGWLARAPGTARHLPGLWSAPGG